MISLVPILHELVGSTASRSVVQLRELGVDPVVKGVAVTVVLSGPVTPGRLLMATTLVDLLLRLDPLVKCVGVDGMDEETLLASLADHVPLQVKDGLPYPSYSVAIGADAGHFDLWADATGWVMAIGRSLEQADQANPIGPMAGACLVAGEIFKWAFRHIYPDRAQALDLMPWTGTFSFYSYAYNAVSPPIPKLDIATTLVGAGGVGAGFLRAIGALGEHVSGSLDIVDGDVLSTDNLNRVSYATVTAALAGRPKVGEARRWLAERCPNLTVFDHQGTFDVYKRREPRREARLYDVVVTGVDNDETRWEVQRDLPRILVDGSTGRDMVTRVERTEFGRYGCLGCSRRPAPIVVGHCDDPPDEVAPSLSFLSAFPGVLAAGEVIKEAMGTGSPRGNFDHIFRYGPNPDLVGMPAQRPDCQVRCCSRAKVAQYRRKYEPAGRQRG